jgi:hypothetical protein
LGKLRAILNSDKLPWALRYKLWAQCANLSTQFENVLIAKYMNALPYEKMHNKEPKWLDNLHTFGEIAVIHDSTKIKSKLADKGLLSMFFGYPDNHAREVCLFLNLTTKRLIQSRSAIFFHKTCSNWYKLKQELISHVPAPTIEDDTNENVPFEQDVLQIQDYGNEPFQNLVDDLPDDDEYDYTESTYFFTNLL